MKCAKCGFISFDFLSECKKCGTNIAGTREALGFDGNKPAIPFFLGALLQDFDKIQSGSEGGNPENTVSSFDFGEESDSRNGDFKLDDEPGAQLRESEDFSLLDLTDDELDLLIADGEVKKSGAQGAAASVPEQAANAPGEQPPAQSAALASGPEPASATAAAPEGVDGQNLHIELTEQDLETLLSELGSTPANKDKKE